MGYFVNLDSADFGIPQSKWDAAFKALVKLDKRDDLKTGGRWSPESAEPVERWFAWLSPHYVAEAREAAKKGEVEHPLIHVFEALGFECEVAPPLHDEEPSFRLLYYDNKTGNEEEFLRAVAPYVDPGSYLDWRGEDGAMWRLHFDGETMTTREGRVVYE